MRPFWMLLGLVAMVLGTAGAFLPMLPTTPFLLLAAFAFARGSPRLHEWLVTHPRFGPLILEWRRHGAIRRPIKLLALASMALSLGLTALAGFAPWILASQAVVLAAAAIFIATRPEPPQ